jgi:hypothetical protein
VGVPVNGLETVEPDVVPLVSTFLTFSGSERATESGNA